MQLKPLYTVRFHYPDGWETGFGGGEELHFYFGEGNCDGAISGKFRGANHPHRRTDGTFEMDFQGFIKTDDGALILFDYQGYGRAYPPGRRQVVGMAKLFSEHGQYRRLNNTICVISGEVRRPVPPPTPITQKDIQLVFSVAELIWEPPPE